MLQSLLSALNVTPLDVQVWDCVPLIVLNADNEVAYGQASQIEFTPFSEEAKTIGHAIAMSPGKTGTCPEISVETRQYIDNPIELSRRQGIILQGTDQNEAPVTWLINGAADRYFTTPDAEQIPYDEETAKFFEEDEETETGKLNLNSFI